MMLQSYEQTRNCTRLLLKLGYRYIVGWKDVNGYRLHAVRNVEWLRGNGTYVNLLGGGR